MMKSTYIFKIIFLVLLAIGCNNIKKDDTTSTAYNSPKTEYIKWKKVFSDSLTSHFPEHLDDGVFACNSSYRNTPQKILYLTLIKQLSHAEKEDYVKITHNPDSCLFPIFYYKNAYGFDKRGLGDCDVFIPMPEYDLIYPDRKAPDDVKYYVLEISNKKFINHDLYLRDYLPEEWKNGMSRGVGISEKENTIFYWLIMW